MEVAQQPSAIKLGTDNKRQCVRIKARIKIHNKDQSLEPVDQTKPPYQAYCETVTSSRPQSPDIFTTPPTHSVPFQPANASTSSTYTARITTRKDAVTLVSANPTPATDPQHDEIPTAPLVSTGERSKHNDSYRRSTLGATVTTNRYHTVSHPTTPRGSHLGAITERMPRNHTPSHSQVQQANSPPKSTTQVVTTRTPLQQKRYGRMEYHPLPPLPPSPPETPIDARIVNQDFTKTTVNFSRGEIQKKSPQVQEQIIAPHLACVDACIPPPILPPPVYNHAATASNTAGHERQQSKASRRTVTFADDTTLSSRSSSPDQHCQNHDRFLRRSKSFSSDAQIPSSLRLYRSHDTLLVGNQDAVSNDINAHASRRTTPKDFKHKYAFGQRPASRMTPSPGLSQTINPNYNPRLSTSKAQYRGLATLPRPLPSSLRVAKPTRDSQTGPRQPPWGSLEDLEERREKRVDARDRDQAKQFRDATLSQASTVGGEDGFGKEQMKREVEEYKESVLSVYPDMAFDGKAGKGGRSCCCVVM